MTSVILGAVAAVAWGLSILKWSDAVRAGDPWGATAQQLSIGALVLVIPGAIELVNDSFTAAGLAAAAGSGVATGAAALTSSLAVREEQVSLVTPLISLEGTIAALIAVATGEHLATGVAIGVVMAATGAFVALVGSDARKITRGSFFGLCAGVLYGISLWLVAESDVPPMATIAIQQGVGAAMLTIVIGPGRVRRHDARRVVVPALLFSLGFVAYTVGARAESVAVTAVLGGQFAVVAMLLAHHLRAERLVTYQYWGVGLLMAGVAVVALSSGG